MNWAQRLTRVFGIEIDTCQCCGGTLRIIASIEQPEVFAKILSYLERTEPQPHPRQLPPGGAVPAAVNSKGRGDGADRSRGGLGSVCAGMQGRDFGSADPGDAACQARDSAAGSASGGACWPPD